MCRKLTGLGLACLVLTLSTGLVACGDDEPTTALLFDINGTWDFTWTNTVTTGICEGELGDVSTGVITITETLPVEIGSAITMTGFQDEPANSVVGSVASGNLIVTQGSYPEDDGTTTTRYELTSVSATRMEGTEFWSFTNSTGSCPDSRASVVATKQ